jgi:hypothetical protein
MKRHYPGQYEPIFLASFDVVLFRCSVFIDWSWTMFGQVLDMSMKCWTFLLIETANLICNRNFVNVPNHFCDSIDIFHAHVNGIFTLSREVYGYN